MWPKVIPGLPHRRHLRRYGELGRLLLKYGRIDIGSMAGVDADRAPEVEPKADSAGAGELAADLAADLEHLGPTFVKLGQLLSTRADLLPVPYLEALARLQDDVAPFPFDEVEPIVTGELGVRLSKAFSFFEPEPIAAASLGQVHRAALRDGRTVAVKVQRPHIQRQIVEDLEALLELAGVLERHTQVGRRVALRALVDQFRRSLIRELDYRQEARNLDLLAGNMAGFDRIVVPRPVDDYTTARVLTSDYIRGDKVTSLTPLDRTETDGSALADDLFQAYLQQILVDGFVHADPHPGNVVLTRDGRIALLDLGMVTRIAPRLQERLLQLLLAVSEGRADEAATVAIRIGEPLAAFDEAMFRREVADLVSRTRDASLEELQVGQIVLRLTKLSVDGGIRVPPELALLGKTLLNLDQIGHVLDPDFDPNAALRRHSSRLLGARMRRELSPGRVFATALDVKELLESLPQRVNRILETVARNELALNVDAIDEQVLVAGFQKIANRITVGIILAALVVGAALLMRVDTAFRLFGYPGLAILCFLAAAAGGVGLILDIVFGDGDPFRRRR